MSPSSGHGTSTNPTRKQGQGSMLQQQQPSPIATPVRQYFSRRNSSRNNIPTVPIDKNYYVGIYSFWAAIWGFLFLIVPLAYIYISFVLVREVCRAFPDSFYYAKLCEYVPFLGNWIVLSIQHRGQFISVLVESWCYIEAIFFFGMKLRIRWLNARDPLEASLSAAPLMDLDERRILWDRMMGCEADDPIGFLQGWFFDEKLSKISRYDCRDFLAWSMFEARHIEHLTTKELNQLEGFVDELESRISLQLFGSVSKEQDRSTEESMVEDDNNSQSNVTSVSERKDLPHPVKRFRFHEEIHQDEPNFFSNLFENYLEFKPVQDFRNLVKNTDFRPVQEFRNLLSETAQHIVEAEETARATASQTASQVYETLVPSGSMMDKQLSAMSRATYIKMTEAWDSVKNIKERLETARFLSKQRQLIRQQLKGYRIMLNRMRDMSSGVPSKQMATLMRRITESYEAMESLEGRARTAFARLTGFALKNMPFALRREPQRFAKYSSDPLIGIATYPLAIHIILLVGFEVALRIMMFQRGFERKTIGPVSYYVHRGTAMGAGDNLDDARTPIVFVHGIGVGLISYMPLIDGFLKTGRPIMLPEIPYVSGFRPWQSHNAVLPPGSVSSTMTAMLATHGFLSATWLGHSYGTTWISYVCKYAPDSVAAVLFLDPICFCLHVPRLTKHFVYMKPDPGTISYIVRTDIIVNWTIQRSFPWQWIVLFVEQINVPCSIFLSDKDLLVPAERVENYLRSKNVPVQDFESVRDKYSMDTMMNCTIFRGHGHGNWITGHPRETIPTICTATELLCQRTESFPKMNHTGETPLKK